MAISRDVTANLYNDSSSPNTQSVNCTGIDTLIAFVEDPVNTAGNCTGATYNSVAMTEMARVKRGGTNRELIIFGLHNPASGSNTLSVTRTSNAVGRFLVGAVGLSGTDTSAALTGRDQDYSSASTTLGQITLGNASGDWVGAITVSASGGQSAGGNTTLINTFDIVSMWTSNTEPTNSSSWTLNVSQTSSQMGMTGIYVPAGAGGGGVTHRMLPIHRL